MKTLSPTQVRANMTRWLDQAIAGKSIGITHKGHIIKLQPVAVTEDWAAEEYDLTTEELDAAAERVLQEGEAILKSRTAISWTKFRRGPQA